MNEILTAHLIRYLVFTWRNLDSLASLIACNNMRNLFISLYTGNENVQFPGKMPVFSVLNLNLALFNYFTVSTLHEKLLYRSHTSLDNNLTRSTHYTK